jgi:hypothetical protein
MGTRVIVDASSGTFEGERLRGTVQRTRAATG